MPTACADERRITELELPWLAGYEGSAPVRTGNAAYSQFQLDIFGEVANTLFQCRRAGIEPATKREGVGPAIIEFLETGLGRNRTKASGKFAARAATLLIRR